MIVVEEEVAPPSLDGDAAVDGEGTSKSVAGPATTSYFTNHKLLLTRD